MTQFPTWFNRVKASDSELRLITGEFVVMDGTQGILSNTGVGCSVIRNGGVGTIRINLSASYNHLQSYAFSVCASGSTTPWKIQMLSSSVTGANPHVAARVVSGSIVQDPTQYITGSYMLWLKNTPIR